MRLLAILSLTLLVACATDEASEPAPSDLSSRIGVDEDDLGEITAELGRPSCPTICTWTTPCNKRCNDWEGYPTTCGIENGICATSDDDGDGVLGPVDNCPFAWNPDQADCDRDGPGNACDPVNGIYQVQLDQVCHVDEDGFPLWGKIEYYAERRYIDVSACGSPPRYETYLRETYRCFNLSERQCCEFGAGSDNRARQLCNHIGDNYCLGS